jgi:hypothetical protein
VGVFIERVPGWGVRMLEDVYALLLPGTPFLVEELQLHFEDTVQLTRELVDAAPLPVVCNNPACEAAAACKAYSECRCRYT